MLSVKRGEKGERGAVNGTYVHPLVFTQMMQWASPTFGVAVASWIEEWKKVDGNLDRFMEVMREALPYQDERPEAAVQEELAEMLGADREVECSTGYIDLLTDDLLIEGLGVTQPSTQDLTVEVKCTDGWQKGVGQLLTYGLDYPNHRRILYLYDGKPKREVREACRRLDVEVMWKKEQLV